jgi:hypothetical protein
MEALVDPDDAQFLVANQRPLLPAIGMDIKHITSDTLRSLLGITSKKEDLIKAVADIENEIAKVIKGAVTSVVDVAEAVTPSKQEKTKERTKKSKATKKPAAAKKKTGLTPEGRAKLAASMKARWAAKKAGKPSSKPAKKGSKNR